LPCASRRQDHLCRRPSICHCRARGSPGLKLSTVLPSTNFLPPLATGRQLPSKFCPQLNSLSLCLHVSDGQLASPRFPCRNCC
jgi:hypothetical protein